MTGRADERPYEQPAPETGPAVTSANLEAEAEDQKTAQREDDVPAADAKKSTAKRGSAKN